jgi:hypothetical protein
MSRLSTLAPELEQRIQSASAAECQTVAHTACQKAVASIKASPLQETVLGLLANPGTQARFYAELLAQDAERLDNAYFALSRRNKMRSIALFTMARVSSALALALSDSRSDWLEAIYEACMAFDTPEPLLAELEVLMVTAERQRI